MDRVKNIRKDTLEQLRALRIFCRIFLTVKLLIYFFKLLNLSRIFAAAVYYGDCYSILRISVTILGEYRMLLKNSTLQNYDKRIPWFLESFIVQKLL
ncbi:hypothetical protein [Enterococcus sp. HY326]|uniref:hypothetical protein n=1 Tax=Enterococcus sp. HY326 TaxID=2971265 RepID=UPI00223EC021|nr:hypothetical protein [Enterococcus sp. HY326]